MLVVDKIYWGRKDRGVYSTLLFPKLVTCFFMHSSYSSGDHGENVRGRLATFSRIAGDATSTEISR